jgi:hypothetical protein
MGWASGTTICIDAWETVREYTLDEKRPIALSKLVISLQQQDWDCEDEIENEWPEAKEALRLAEMHWKAYWKRRRS